MALRLGVHHCPSNGARGHQCWVRKILVPLLSPRMETRVTAPAHLSWSQFSYNPRAGFTTSFALWPFPPFFHPLSQPLPSSASSSCHSAHTLTDEIMQETIWASGQVRGTVAPRKPGPSKGGLGRSGSGSYHVFGFARGWHYGFVRTTG